MYFVIPYSEGEVEEGAVALLVAREEDAFPPAFVAAALFPKKQIKACVLHFIYINEEFEKEKEKIKGCIHTL